MITPPLPVVTLYHVNIHSIDLDRIDWRSTLSSDEIDQSDRFHKSDDRLRHIIARLVARRVLCRWMHCNDSKIQFDYGSHGKPFVQYGPSFNLSHSGPSVVFAIAEGGELGVDIEYVKPLVDLQAMATRVFSETEMKAYTALPAGDRQRAFFRVWARKESFIKALGTGVSTNLQLISVSIDDTTGNALTSLEIAAAVKKPWWIQSIGLAGRAEAAVSLSTGQFSISLQDVTEQLDLLKP